MITYNHEPFIAEAIESVLMQETEHQFELVIGEDNSTDATRKICEEYQNRYPDKIRLIKAAPQNLGMMLNFTKTFAACDGDLIALLEGDDYWLTIDKLQMQATFLINNPNYVACFTHHQTIYSNSNIPVIESLRRREKRETLTFKMLIRWNPIATGTVMYRKLYQSLPEWFTNLPIGDWPLHIIHAQQGLFKCIPEITSCYRVHTQNNYANLKHQRKISGNIQVLQILLKHLSMRYYPFILRSILVHYVVLTLYYVKQQHQLQSIADSIQSLKRKLYK